MKREYLSGKFVWTPVSPQSRTCIARVTLSILRNSKAEGPGRGNKDGFGGGEMIYKINKRWNPPESSDKGTTGLLFLPERTVNVFRLSRIIYEIKLLTLFHF